MKKFTLFLILVIFNMSIMDIFADKLSWSYDIGDNISSIAASPDGAYIVVVLTIIMYIFSIKMGHNYGNSKQEVMLNQWPYLQMGSI